MIVMDAPTTATQLAHEREARAQAIKDLSDAQNDVARLEDELEDSQNEVSCAQADAEDARLEGYGEARTDALTALEDVQRGVRTLDEVITNLRAVRP